MTYVGLVAADGVLSLIWLSVIFQSTLNRVSWECRTRIDGDENDKCHSVAKLPYWICLWRVWWGALIFFLDYFPVRDVCSSWPMAPNIANNDFVQSDGHGVIILIVVSTDRLRKEERSDAAVRMLLMLLLLLLLQMMTKRRRSDQQSPAYLWQPANIKLDRLQLNALRCWAYWCHLEATLGWTVIMPSRIWRILTCVVPPVSHNHKASYADGCITKQTAQAASHRFSGFACSHCDSNEFRLDRKSGLL